MIEDSKKFALSDLTSAEFHQLIPCRPIILLPLGSQEDQGAHAPMGDYRLAEMVAWRIAASANSSGVLTLAAPTLPFGAADHFGAIAGGMALRPSIFREVLVDLLDELLRHGLTRIIVFNGHGGNVPIIHEVTVGLRRKGSPIIPSFYLWKIAQVLMQRRYRINEGAFGHGGEPLTSISLWLRREAMRPDLWVSPEPAGRFLDLPIAGFGCVDFEGIPIDVPIEYDLVAPNSAFGDAKEAKADIGHAIVDELVKFGVRFCAHMATAPK